MEHPVTSFLLTEVNIPQYAPPALTSITSIFYIAQQSDFHYFSCPAILGTSPEDYIIRLVEFIIIINKKNNLFYNA